MLSDNIVEPFAKTFTKGFVLFKVKGNYAGQRNWRIAKPHHLLYLKLPAVPMNPDNSGQGMRSLLQFKEDSSNPAPGG